jgi:DNA-binding response OmpR family regulator
VLKQITAAPRAPILGAIPRENGSDAPPSYRRRRRYLVAVDELLQKALAYGDLAGAAMFAALERYPIDLVDLEVMLPREDGFSLCKKLRAASRVPIITLTAVTDHTDRTVGLELGADDYITSPFDQSESLALVKAVDEQAADMRLRLEASIAP